MNKKLHTLLYLTCVCAATLLCLPASGQARTGDVAFRAGEELRYTASYNASVLSTDVAEATLRVSEDTHERIPSYKVTARGVTKPFFSVFFKLEDVYETWMEKSTLRPLMAKSTIREGNYRAESRFAFNWKSNMVYTHRKNLKKNSEKNKTMPLQAKDFDAIAHFYNLRCENIETMKPGERRTIRLVLTDNIRTIQYRYIGQEIIETPTTGKVRCRKFACQLTNDEANSFQEGSEFLVWISDDKNKVPIYLETPIRVGKVYATITGWKNLKYPFTSQVK